MDTLKDEVQLLEKLFAEKKHDQYHNTLQSISASAKQKNHSRLHQLCLHAIELYPHSNNEQQHTLAADTIQLSQCYLRLPGIDITYASGISCDNLDFIHNLLISFIQNNHDFCQYIQDITNSKDYESLLNKVHAIKGAAGNFGAVYLSEACATLEQLLKTKGAPEKVELDNAIHSITTTFTALRKTTKNLQHIINKTDSVLARNSTSNHVQQLNSLQEKLEDSDLSAEIDYRKLVSFISAKDSLLAETIQTAMNQLDYRLAAKKLNSFIATLR